MRDDSSELWIWILLIAGGCYFAYTQWIAPDEDGASGDDPISITARPESVRPIEDILVAKTESGTVWRLDSDTVQGDKSNRTGWLTLDHTEDSSVTYRTSRQLWQIDCGIGSYKILSRISYLPSGDIAFSESLDSKDAEISYAIPETNGDAVVRSFCAEGFN